MSKLVDRWWSPRIGMELTVARWGSFGTPVLVFPTAGGDAEEIERQGVVEACGALLAGGRVKLYSCDSVAGRAMIEEWGSAEQRMALADAYHAAIIEEVVPALFADSGGREQPLLSAGASIGAFNALAVLCRYPHVFRAAVCMSGSYDLSRFYDDRFSDDLYYASPSAFLRGLEGPQLDLLRQRFTLLACGSGRWESVDATWQMADVLGAKGIPNRVDVWGTEWDHDWPTWRRMLPQYLAELVAG